MRFRCPYLELKAEIAVFLRSFLTGIQKKGELKNIFNLKLSWHLHIDIKAELQQEGIFFALNFLPWDFLLIKKLEINKTKTTFIMTVLKVVC